MLIAKVIKSNSHVDYAARVLDSVLYGVRSTDVVSYAGSIVVVVLVAIGATLLPALQAARVAPSYALRAE